jgi:hypothetical protein
VEHGTIHFVRVECLCYIANHPQGYIFFLFEYFIVFVYIMNDMIMSH